MSQSSRATDVNPKHLAFVSMGLAFLLILTLSASIFVLALEDKPFNVLSDYSVQTIDDVTETTVTATGVKCQTHDEPITVVGESNWFRVIPPGFGTPEVPGIRQGVLPGCTTLTFVNTIPQTVLDVNIPGDVWFITGIEWPIDPDTGRRGEGITWVTENFELLTE